MPKPISKKKKIEADIAAAADALQKIEEAALRFKALGDSTRLRIVLFLRAAQTVQSIQTVQDAQGVHHHFDKGSAESLSLEADTETPGEDYRESDSLTVGAVALHLTGSDKVSSNVSHHLKELRHAGLITMKRRGKNILCRVNPSALGGLSEVLCSKSETWPQALGTEVTTAKAPTKKGHVEVTES